MLSANSLNQLTNSIHPYMFDISMNLKLVACNFLYAKRYTLDTNVHNKRYDIRFTNTT